MRCVYLGKLTGKRGVQEGGAGFELRNCLCRWGRRRLGADTTHIDPRADPVETMRAKNLRDGQL